MKVDRPNPAQFASASPAEKARLAETARQFEALLMKQVVTTLQAPLRQGASGPGRGMYETLADDALAQHMTRGQGAGIARTLYRQWTGDTLPGEPVRRAAPSMMPSMAALAAPGVSPELAPEGGIFSPMVDDGVTPLRDLLPPDGLNAAPTVQIQPASLGTDDGRPLRELLPPDGTDDVFLNPEQFPTDDTVGETSVRHGVDDYGHQESQRSSVSLDRRDAQPARLDAYRQRVLRAYEQGRG